MAFVRRKVGVTQLNMVELLDAEVLYPRVIGGVAAAERLITGGLPGLQMPLRE